MANMKSRCGEDTSNGSVAGAYIAQGGRVHFQSEPKLNASANR